MKEYPNPKSQKKKREHTGVKEICAEKSFRVMYIVDKACKAKIEPMHTTELKHKTYKTIKKYNLTSVS